MSSLEVLEEIRKELSAKLLKVMQDGEDGWQYGQVMAEPYILIGSHTIVVPNYDDGEMTYEASFIHLARGNASDEVRNTLVVLNCYGCMKKFGIRSRKRAIEFALEV
jgi:hypothetical protein